MVKDYSNGKSIYFLMKYFSNCRNKEGENGHISSNMNKERL